MYDDSNLSEERQVFLHEYCPCGGRVHRFVLSGRISADDNGGEFVCTQVHDRCDTCRLVLRWTTVAPSPLAGLELLFDQFEHNELPRDEFDELVSSEFVRYGGSGIKTA